MESVDIRQALPLLEVIDLSKPPSERIEIATEDRCSLLRKIDEEFLSRIRNYDQGLIAAKALDDKYFKEIKTGKVVKSAAIGGGICGVLGYIVGSFLTFLPGGFIGGTFVKVSTGLGVGLGGLGGASIGYAQASLDQPHMYKAIQGIYQTEIGWMTEKMRESFEQLTLLKANQNDSNAQEIEQLNLITYFFLENVTFFSKAIAQN